MKYPTAGDLQKELVHQVTGNPKRNPTLSRDQVIDEFDRLLRDPDPSGMLIAQDLLIHHGLSLIDVGQEFARRHNRSGEPPSLWRVLDLDRRPTSKGLLVLGPQRLAAALYPIFADELYEHDHISVSWIVAQDSLSGQRSPMVSSWSVALRLTYGGVTWYEDGSGGWGYQLVDRDLPEARVARIAVPLPAKRRGPVVVKSRKTPEEAVAAAATSGWIAARTLKEAAQRGWSFDGGLLDELRVSFGAMYVPPEFVSGPDHSKPAPSSGSRVATGTPKRKAKPVRKRNPEERGPLTALKLFRELLLDPDAGSLTAAIDVLLEAGLTLRQVSEDEKRAEMAREEPKLEMTSFETSRLKPGEVQGLFRLGDATVVQWTVFHGRAQQASEDDYGRWVTRDIKRYGIDIEGYFHGVPWYYRVGESQNTPATARWYDTSKEAVARAIEDAWFAVHVMKRYWEESPPAVVGRLEAGALGQYDEETLNNFMIYDIPSEVVQ